jgi:radical SAM superfamily enzyme YgiQ (UPF0313 family)
MGLSLAVNVVLLSTYELGHQPFGLASPAAWLRNGGNQVTVADLSRQRLPEQAVRRAGLVAFHLPMHTATRLAVPVAARVRTLNPQAHLCAYGLYAPANQELLRSLGFRTILGGEFESALAELAASLQRGVDPGGAALVSLERLRFLPPDRDGLPSLDRYAPVETGSGPRAAGYTEASRGCKHLCRHCPIVPVYRGAFRVVQRDIVLEDIRRQAAAGARHITFGDPDFFNGPAHARRLVEDLHREHPGLTYDVTIKIEHLLRHRDLLPVLRDTGCLFVTSAVESLDDAVLEKLAKGHSRADFFEAVSLMRDVGLALAPTFVAFTPWTTLESYRELLSEIARLDLAGAVAPIQLAIRLLIPSGSRLLELEEIRRIAGPFDARALSHVWRHADPHMDELCRSLQSLIRREEQAGAGRGQIFSRIWEMAYGAPPGPVLVARAAIPYLTEPWYC